MGSWGAVAGRYKLINFYSNDGLDLFDLKNDPREMTSVHDSPEYATVLTDMKKRLAEMRAHYDLPPRRGEK